MRLFLFTVMLSTLVSSCVVNSPTESPPDHIEKQVDSLVQQYIDFDIFSGVVQITKAGKPFYFKAFGMANREEKIPNTILTHFDIGSMNKTFTKVVILQLIDEDKLQLDDNLGKFLSGFSPKASGKITVAHLLNHRSGMGTYHIPAYFALPLSEKTLANSLDFIRKEKLAFEPGTSEQYSNSGYVLLGAIIEKVTGKSYFDAIDERIVQPLHLTHTFLRNKYTVPNRASGYFKTMKGELVNNDFLQESPTPAGGFLSTASDISTFYQAYHNGNQLLSPSARKNDDRNDFYEACRANGSVFAHAGGFEGANTVDYENLHDSLSIIVLANMNEPVAEELGAGILAIIRNTSPAHPSLPAMQNVYEKYQKYGLKYVETHWDSLSKNWHASDPKDLILNQIGYEIMDPKNPEKISEAKNIFRLNTILFPDVGNVWDSYGEALLLAGDSTEALQAYQKALSINPDIPSAGEAVAKITTAD